MIASSCPIFSPGSTLSPTNLTPPANRVRAPANEDPLKPPPLASTSCTASLVDLRRLPSSSIGSRALLSWNHSV